MTSLNRRTVAKGAAWAAPLVVASTAIPVYAASRVEYGFSASWFSSLAWEHTSYCTASDGAGELTSFEFWTDQSYNGDAPGFGIPELNGSETTNVTLDGISFQAAFPAGFVDSISVVTGSWAVSGPSATTVNGSAVDVFTFTFTGSTTGTTSNTVAWPGSGMTTDVVFNNAECFSLDALNSGTYWVRWSGSYTTDNGFNRDISSDWLDTNFA